MKKTVCRGLCLVLSLGLQTRAASLGGRQATLLFIVADNDI
jgi:hypothetical protein